MVNVEELLSTALLGKKIRTSIEETIIVVHTDCIIIENDEGKTSEYTLIEFSDYLNHKLKSLKPLTSLYGGKISYLKKDILPYLEEQLRVIQIELEVLCKYNSGIETIIPKTLDLINSKIDSLAKSIEDETNHLVNLERKTKANDKTLSIVKEMLKIVNSVLPYVSIEVIPKSTTMIYKILNIDGKNSPVLIGHQATVGRNRKFVNTLKHKVVYHIGRTLKINKESNSEVFDVVFNKDNLTVSHVTYGRYEVEVLEILSENDKRIKND